MDKDDPIELAVRRRERQLPKVPLFETMDEAKAWLAALDLESLIIFRGLSGAALAARMQLGVIQLLEREHFELTRAVESPPSGSPIIRPT